MYVCVHVCEAYPVTTAGPKALAGLMQFELMGPVIHMLKVIPRAIANGPNCPQPLQTQMITCLLLGITMSSAIPP